MAAHRMMPACVTLALIRYCLLLLQVIQPLAVAQPPPRQPLPLPHPSLQVLHANPKFLYSNGCSSSWAPPVVVPLLLAF